MNQTRKTTFFIAVTLLLMSSALHADQVVQDDQVVRGSLCVGLDCVDGENFSFDTLRMKENNLRIHFDDTSSSASFPRWDWRLVANESRNGGLNFFGLEDVTQGRFPLRVVNTTRRDALVLSLDRVGVGTNAPQATVHAVSGNTSTLRLEQDGSQGFASQVWELGSNESNFFLSDPVRDLLPLRVFVGAPSNALVVDEAGQVGLGTINPAAGLHVQAGDGSILADASLAEPAARVMLELRNAGPVSLRMRDEAAAGQWVMTATGGDDGRFEVATSEGGEARVSVDAAGNLDVAGDISSNGQALNVPDYVFEDDYALMSLDDLERYIQTEKHLPRVPSAADIQRDGLKHSAFQMRLLEKVEELTLYTLTQEKTLKELRTQNDALLERLERLESKLAEQEGGR